MEIRLHISPPKKIYNNNNNNNKKKKTPKWKPAPIMFHNNSHLRRTRRL